MRRHGGGPPPTGPYGTQSTQGPPCFAGTLRDWNPRKACGFIDCPELGRPYFAHKSEFVDQFADGEEPPVGTPVTFYPGIDQKSGKERACNIRVDGYGGWAGYGCGGRPHAAGPSYGPSHYGPPSHGASASFQGPVRGAPSPRLTGDLLEWDAAKACGFIECHDPRGKRLFAHKSDFVVQFADGEEPPIGTGLTFFMGVNPKSGKLRAQDIEIQHSSVVRRVERFSGTLEEWNPQRACGFIHCQSSSGTKRLFAHKSEFIVPFADGEEPAKGTAVSFVPGHDVKSGKERAQEIQLENGLAASDGLKGRDGGRPRVFGSLCEWNIQKGWGFIECLDTPGKKLFAHKSDFSVQFADGDEPPIGAALSFVFGMDVKSRRERAQEIQVEHREPR